MGIRQFTSRSVLGQKMISATAPRRTTRRLRSLEREIADSSRILVGPWTSELGFEILYWIPLLRRLLRGVSPTAEVSVISRGGAGVWYPRVDRYVDVFDIVDDDTWQTAVLPALVNEGLAMKQTRVSSFDRDIRMKFAADDVFWLHPRLLFELLGPFFAGYLGPSAVSAMLDFDTVLPRQVSWWSSGDTQERTVRIEGLPPEFVAVRGYARESIRPSDVQAGIKRILDEVYPGMPVVDLSMGYAIDDHREVAWTSANHSPLVHLDTRLNLALQSEVVSRARGFVCTYGGSAYMGLQTGTPTYAVVGDPGMYMWKHMMVARVMERATSGRLTLVQCGEPIISALERGRKHDLEGAAWQTLNSR